MQDSTMMLLQEYTEKIKNVYGEHLKSVILYGSYARGDYNKDSDIDIMILLDIDDLAIKQYRRLLSYMTYTFNMDNNVDIKPIAKNRDQFNKWIEAYPFYSNIVNEGVILYGAA